MTTPASSPNPSALTVLLAAPGTMNAVRDALTDWSAVGLVQPFLWIDSSGVQPHHVPALGIADGRPHGTTVQHALSGTRYARIRICSLVPLLGANDDPATTPVDAAVEAQIAQLVLANAQAKVELVRCLVARPDAAPRSEVAREGWHNILISPEDSRGPGLGRTVFTEDDDPLHVAGPAAAAIAGLTGLWTGIGEAPLDDVSPPPGRTVRLARTFTRGFTAAEVEQQVRAGVLTTEDGLPAPRQQSAMSVHAEDVPAATSAMASALWHKHRSILRGPRATAAPETAQEIGGGQAFKMFMGFLWNSLKGSPTRWYTGVVHAVSSATAKVTHEMVFGAAPSSYAVVVGGVRADGNPAGWEDLALASSQMSEALNQGQHQQAAPADLSTVMKDYVAGAMTLADGGDHAHGMPPIQIGPDRAVLRDPSDCAPGPQDNLQIPTHLVDQVGYPSLHPSDLLGTQMARARLGEASRNQHLAVEADRVDAEIQGWQQRFARSYPVQVGNTLVRQIQSTAGEVRSLLNNIQSAAEVPDLSGEIQAKQRSLALAMRIVLGAFLVFLAADIVVAVKDLILVKHAVWIGIGLLLLWLIVTGAMFFTGQRALFGELHRRRVAAGQAEVNRENLRHASNDLKRLTETYGHYLVWSRIAGAAIAQPFGPAPQVAPDPEPISAGLPMATRFGVAEVQPDQVSRAVVTIRRDLYRIGWMTVPWEQLLAEAGARIGPDGYEVSERPDRLFGMAPGPQSLLSRWADVLEHQGTGTTSGNQIWQYVLGTFDGPQAELKESLVTQVRVGAGGPRGVTSQPMADFMANVDLAGQAGQVGPQSFDGAVLSVGARMGSRTAVTQQWSRGSGSGLARTVVLVQLGDGFPDYELAMLDQSLDAPQHTQAKLGSEDAATWTF
ncbi:MAG TPA: hypothetical protein IAA98_15320 [Candidatus Avipropionibacterium avicola]|uniref:Uncharacterized protein n=1 Tax=Candidatus Avipropionibacterium avicola TaxID=2840701 RepID=A0A9D1H0V1_9ACTN|nr:hypothetical protein [Candidatus Avipropionibacterium avicola]